MAEVTISIVSSVISSLIKKLVTDALEEFEGISSIEFKLREILKNTCHLELEKHQVRGIELVAYRLEDAIERLLWLQWRTGVLARYYHYPPYVEISHKIGEGFDRISNLIPGIFGEQKLNSSDSGENSSPVNDQFENWLYENPRKSLYSVNNDEMVGSENLTKEILGELEDLSNKELSCVSIFGMWGGIGKSTLARKVFNATDTDHFLIKIWITIPRQYNVVDIRKKILKDILNIKDKIIREMSDKDVNGKLYESLEQKRYLLVLDGLWDKKTWDDVFFLNSESQDETNPLKSIFPDKNNGSRIIVTTRERSVARHPNFIKTFEHEVQPLDDEESWELLKKKAFPSYITVSEPNKKQLESLGPKLARKCKGLPLALVILGSCLSKHLDYQTWLRMSEDVDLDEAGDEVNISKIFALGYQDLPKELKPIFLYIMVFPENSVIKSSDLIKLWMAEGLIPDSRRYKLEDMARLHLNQLYERSLVQVVKWSRAHERISAIKIHDVLRNWGIKTAEEEGFFQVSDKNDNKIAHDQNIPYRIALDGYCNQSLATFMPHLRTVLGFNLPEHQVSFDGLSSLRAVRMDRFTLKVGVSQLNINYMHRMIFLRYICLTNYGIIYLPSAIGKLRYLQTLDCRHHSYIRSLPISLWKISTLRHLYLRIVVCKWKLPQKELAKNLQTLVISSVNLFDSDWKGLAEALEEMSEIVRLDLDFPFYKTPLPRKILSNITRLRSLEVLKLTRMEGLTIIPDDIFPPNLVSVSLYCDKLQHDPMPVFGKLPQLAVLKLYYNHHLRSMHCSVDGFRRLKYLLLHKFHKLEQWTIYKDAIPSLSHVRLEDCENLELSQEELMDVSQLQLLELVKMSKKMYEADYSKLKKKEPKSKVILAEDWNDSRLSDL